MYVYISRAIISLLLVNCIKDDAFCFYHCSVSSRLLLPDFQTALNRLQSLPVGMQPRFQVEITRKARLVPQMHSKSCISYFTHTLPSTNSFRFKLSKTCFQVASTRLSNALSPNELIYLIRLNSLRLCFKKTTPPTADNILS